MLPGGSVSFAAGETSKTITVGVQGDTAVEADEGFTVTLSSPTGAWLGSPAQASGTITNDDPNVTLAVSPATVTEDGVANLVYTFSRTGPMLAALTVNYTVGGTATLGTDYTGISVTGTTKSVTFAAGSSTAVVTVDPTADTAIEAAETVSLTLADGMGYNIGTPTAVTGTIRNDDFRSRLSIAATDAVKSEGNIGRTPFTFTLTRTGDLSGVVSVPWSIVGSGASQADRLDFIGGVLPSGTIRLAPGRQTQTLIVNVLCDRIAEFDEQFTITLGTPLGGLDTVEAGLSSAAATIRNDDPGTPRPAAATPAQGRSIVGLAAGNGLATNQVIVAQAFAMLADTSGSAGTNTTKRIAVAIRA